MKNITKIKNIIKRKVNESRLRNKLSVILDDALPNILAEMASLDYIEPTIKEEVNITDIKVGNILNFKDGETWKVIKIIGNKANPSRIMAGPYGKTRDRYISMPIEFTIDNIKKDVKSINEAKSETGINMVKKKLDALGVKYEMSKTDKVRPFKVIYKPINKSDQFYDKFEDIVDLFNLKGVVKSINEAYGKLVVSEGTFFRLPKNVIGNELYLASKNLTNLFNNANAGNDIDTGVIDSIVRQLNTVKKSVKKFNSSEEVKGTVYEAMISSSGAKGLKIGNKIKTQNGTYTITGFGSQTNATKDFEATNEKGKKFNLRVSLRGASGIQVAPAPSLNFPEKEEMLESIVNEAKTYKKGDKLKIKLKNGKEFDLTFDSYGRQKGMAFGKFKDGSGEYDTKPFSLDTIKEEQLDEKLITFSNRAPYGQVVFMAGGAGSGKGFAIQNFIDSAGFKVRDVDEMKKSVGELDKLGKFSIDAWYKKYSKNLKPEEREHVEEFVLGKGLSISDVAGDLKNPNNVAALHYIVDAMGLKDSWLVNMLSGKTNKETLPNLLFDITAKKVSSISDVIKPLVNVGYDPNNIHLIWVLTDYHLAVKQNKSRERVVPDDILLNTHEGAAKTIWSILTSGLPSGLNGRIDVILNNRENTVTYKDSKGNEMKGAVKGFLSLPIKKQGGGILPEKLWKDLLYKWILDNGPKTVDLRKPLDTQMEK
jgi:hypothetical protein